ncbi:cytochrome C oxidase subunit IV family protein [Roseomonas populi]|uniref:Cytochrome C oxidase subunit IV family protein n=1 Tax=Roseomonas populi TaxID=3121582 RepID=A0ABT1X576_9PROT|nr:cytochrome C oxidase subunit IV family protein [Roseomonas pecuniae]MCR0982921.1 cytochrome C oxidase subunit IV family protein [Roseomonas pecuniae]
MSAILQHVLPVWLALLALLGASLALAYAPLHGLNGVVSLGIAAMKAILVAVFFMNLRRPDPLLRLAGGASLIWMSFLFALTFADLAARAPETQPQAGQGTGSEPPMRQPF